MTRIADALRKVTVAMQRAIDDGERSKAIDADDLIQVLLAVADELDPLGNSSHGNLVDSGCPTCGQRDPDMLIWQDDETVRCFGCGTRYQPGRQGL
jgi:hypothetical protein